MLPRPTSAAASSSGAAVFTSGASSDVRSREEELARREEALRIREANAAQAQEDALKYGIKKKNWPICCPITHHDIAGEIPDGSKFNVRVAYGLFYVTFFALWWNWFTILVLWVSPKPDTVTDFRSYSEFLWSMIIAFFGSIGAWFGWYRGMYYGLSRNASCRFLCFFLLFAAHCCFAICAAVGVPATSGCIILIDIAANWKDSQHSYGFQIFLTAVSFCIWTVIAVISCIFLKRFHSQYKSKGQASFQDVKSGAARSAVKGATTVAQTDAFKEAAAGAARSAVQHSLENPAPSQSKPTGSNPFGV